MLYCGAAPIELSSVSTVKMALRKVGRKRDLAALAAPLLGRRCGIESFSRRWITNAYGTVISRRVHGIQRSRCTMQGVGCDTSTREPSGWRREFSSAPQVEMHSVLGMSIAEVSEFLESGQITSVALTQACLDQMEKVRPLRIFITEMREEALKAAREADARIRTGNRKGMLDGIPIAIKDNFATANVRTTAGSSILRDFTPPYESTATTRLLEAGAVPVGKCNMDEFAMGSAGKFSFAGAVVNPWSPPASSPLTSLSAEEEDYSYLAKASAQKTEVTENARETNAEAHGEVAKDMMEGQREPLLIAGGSSSGSAAAVATGCCFLALGSDTGGSVRMPAAYCGVVGVKGTYGRVPRHGLISYASSLDTVGVFSRTVGDAAFALDCLMGPDGFDSTCVQETEKTELYSAASRPVAFFEDKPLQSMTVGIPREYRFAELPADMVEVWERTAQWLAEAGATVVPVSLPSTRFALPAYYVIAGAEASSNLARYDGIRYGSRSEVDEFEDEVNEEEQNAADPLKLLRRMICRTRAVHLGPEVQRRILSGCLVLSEGSYEAYYERALALRKRVKEDFRRVFEDEKVDVLLSPVTPTGPYPLTETNTAKKVDPVLAYVNDVLTVPASLAGLPASSVPIRTSVSSYKRGQANVSSSLIKHSAEDASLASSTGNVEAPAGVDEGEFAVPVAMQVIGRPLGEHSMLAAASVLEARANFAVSVPSYVHTFE